MMGRGPVVGGRFTGPNMVLHRTGAEVFLPHDPSSLTFKNDNALLASAGRSGAANRCTGVRTPDAFRAPKDFAGEIVLSRVRNLTEEYPGFGAESLRVCGPKKTVEDCQTPVPRLPVVDTRRREG
jgi:hypothetical protein